MKVGDLMTPDLEVVAPDDTLKAAARLMADLGCETLPVGENNRLIGTITGCDIALQVAAAGQGRVEMWRSGCRSNISVAAPFVWRCLTGSAVALFPHLAHRTGHADFPHPALGQDVTPSPTARCAHARSGGRDRNARKGARVDKSRPCVA